MRVSVIGTGYVGLVTGVCLAEKGHYVTCVDIDQEKIDKIMRAIPPIYEIGLQELLQKNLHQKLTATTDLYGSVLETDVSFITVGTPLYKDSIDLTFIKDAAFQIGRALRKKTTYHMVVVKSTVVPGTTDEVILPLLEEASGKNAGLHFGVGMNPEFLTEGEAIQDFMIPDRIILGGIDEKSINILEELYSVFEGVPRLRTNTKTAEMIKYTSNALLATLISFSNEIGNLCAAFDSIDVVDVMRGIHLSKYLNPILPDGNRILPSIISFLWSGCGFGGSCLPKDVRALVAHGQKVGCPMWLLDAVLRINEEQPRKVIDLLKKHFPSLMGVHIAILGLAFRPGTDDMRESPAIPIIKSLLAEGAEIKAYDPAATHQAEQLFRGSRLTLCDNCLQTLEGTHAVVLVTRWDEFNDIPQLLARQEPQPLFIDARRMLDKHSLRRYEGIGIKSGF